MTLQKGRPEHRGPGLCGICLFSELVFKGGGDVFSCTIPEVQKKTNIIMLDLICQLVNCNPAMPTIPNRISLFTMMQTSIYVKFSLHARLCTLSRRARRRYKTRLIYTSSIWFLFYFFFVCSLVCFLNWLVGRGETWCQTTWWMMIITGLYRAPR